MSLTFYAVSVFGYVQQDLNVIQGFEISGSIIIMSLVGAITTMAGYIVMLHRAALEDRKKHADKIEAITDRNVERMDKISRDHHEKVSELVKESHKVMQDTRDSIHLSIEAMRSIISMK